MESDEIRIIKEFMMHEIMKLSFKHWIIKKACTTYGISEYAAITLFKEARKNVKKPARNKAWIYFLLGSLSFGVSLFSSVAATGMIFYGGLLIGTGMLITTFGYARIAFRP